MDNNWLTTMSESFFDDSDCIDDQIDNLLTTSNTHLEELLHNLQQLDPTTEEYKIKRLEYRVRSLEYLNSKYYYIINQLRSYIKSLKT